VTGATGFLGRRLLPRLVTAGARVHATTRMASTPRIADVDWVPLDLTHGDELFTAVEAIQPDVVVHLGGRVSGAVDPGLVLPTFDTLLASSVALLAAAQAGSIGRLVLVGSTDEPQSGGAPASPYSAAKGAMMAYAKLYAEAFAAPVVCVRPAETFGPGQAPTKLLPYTAAAVLRGHRPRLASGTRRGDWIYVDDVVDGLLVAAQDAPDGTEVDLGTGVLRTNREVVDGLIEALGSEIRPVWGALPDRPGEPERAADLAHTTRLLSWRPQFSLRDGLDRTARAARLAALDAIRLDDSA
jgi:UDP-glucose 4-epimerase